MTKDTTITDTLNILESAQIRIGEAAFNVFRDNRYDAADLMRQYLSIDRVMRRLERHLDKM